MCLTETPSYNSNVVKNESINHRINKHTFKKFVIIYEFKFQRTQTIQILIFSSLKLSPCILLNFSKTIKNIINLKQT